ncbi:MAG: zinc ribbon domain-containing protein [Anaerolineae bacterium]|nr:zinc ribbon domain-containing protein [Anaerolineae bacterium]
MPIYEYVCGDCGAKFDKMRPMSQANAPLNCAQCGSSATSRALSLFAAVSKGSNGESKAVSGAGHSCASCSGTHCATCNH